MTTMAMALRATKLTMMATTTTMATGNDNDDGNGATGNVATLLGAGRERNNQP